MDEILTEEDKKLMEVSSVTLQFQKGEAIFREKAPVNQVHLVRSGLVKISKDGASNKPLIIKILKPGNFLSLATIFNGGINVTSATAVTNASLTLIERDAFFKIYRRNPAFNESICRQISHANTYLLQQLMSRSVKRLPGRVADTILDLHKLNDESHSFELPLSRVEMAQLAGTTKESLIRTLAEFKHDKIVKLEGRTLTINSLEILQTLSKFG
ncbi:Crp/Fnr family transcriptional regulator [Marinilabilia rubra]|uniref:Crp/Fnr family transcriptional regulator n=1 Tax=Marinilabilia rubra TaxID=2162893 RepID=A0A2U2B779_9BACT|nr:Crp/Fnr family transcriptional regulator [Marinilabilia rubra]PWD98930.1 hypothetical protein DDZ16_13115 [Marinilabilia rubra]